VEEKQGVRCSLYALLFVTPLSGLWAWTRLSELAAELHEAAAAAVLLLIAAHVVGAAVEHFLFGNDSVGRMAPGLGEPKDDPGT
jgi:cytochrome b561